MVLAADYPFLDVFWTMILFFCWVAWIYLLILIVSDLFRRDISGWSKALWVIVLIFLPWLGAFIYLIARGKSMTERQMTALAEQQAAQAEYIQQVAAGGATPATQIAEAKAMLDSGTISQSEFDTLKAKALA